MKTNIANKISPMISKAMMKGKMAAPDIAVYGGLVLVIGSTAVMVKRSIQEGSKIEEYSNKAKAIKNGSPEYAYISEKEKRKELKDLRIEFIKYLTKTYGAPLAGIIIGSGGVLYGTKVIKVQKLAALGEAAILKNRLDALSERVDEALGEGTAKLFQNGGRIEEVDVEYTDENGKKKKKKEKRQVVEYNPDKLDYRMFFDEGSSRWHTTSALNLMVVKEVEQEFTEKLRRRQTYVSLLEVYVDGFKLRFPDNDPRRIIFSNIGWVYDPNRDNVVSMGVFNKINGSKINFVNGYENVLLLDPNIDGPIFGLGEQVMKYV